MRLDDGIQHESEARLLQKSDVIDALAMSLQWTKISNYTFRKSAHINLQEARALRCEIRKEYIRSATPRRIIVFSDSLWCVWGVF